MKFTLKIALASALLASSHVACAQEKPAEIPMTKIIEAPQGMELVWNDEFDNDGPLDPQKWGPELGLVRNQEPQLYQPQNARVENGMLIITARHQRVANPNYKKGSDDWKTKNPFVEYTSSSYTTQGRAAWLYGRFEMRAKIDVRESSWPAFWTLGENRDWPHNGEIDIMEYYDGKVLANIAWGAEKKWGAVWNAKNKAVKKYIDADPDWANKFHVWAMDWDENKITLSLDGEVLNTQDISKTINRDAEGANPFRAPQFILLNQALGHGDPGKIEFPVQFEVDYVRVFQKKK